ncbi:MAG: deoxyguanosinetriphosphate triphosphohydrolase [Deltaproteobacteria bacterium]|nr:deoxyguanosinetriphosphate triphosphohydrolase [Candidatus Tharpella aukensis]
MNAKATNNSNNVREELEQRERSLLAPFAAFSADSRGRKHLETECNYRMAYQHDRDRIIHSKSFRRLKYKTQVFLTPTGDHYRTRLTHTLEVSQIARTIAKALFLNEDLTEAIALGHDLGHTPFGHAGEAVLNRLHPDGFNHFQQSLRVVDIIEKEGRGLNLSFEVRDGIIKHSKGKGPILSPDLEHTAITLEGQIVRLADIIAYVNHDLDDAIRAQTIKAEQIPKECNQILGDSHTRRINTMVTNIIDESRKEPGTLKVSPEIIEAVSKLRSFLFTNVYESPAVYRDFIKASRLLKEIYIYFQEHPQKLKEKYYPGYLENYNFNDNLRDFIASMTDRYAFSLYERLFLPHPWNI